MFSTVYAKRLICQTCICFAFFVVLAYGASAQECEEQRYARKVAPLLSLQKRSKVTDTVMVSVTSNILFEKWMADSFPSLALANIYHNIYRVSGVTAQHVEKLVASPLVVYIDKHYAKGNSERILDNSNLSVNQVTLSHNRYPTILGKGLAIAIKDNLFDTTDIDYMHRIGYCAPFNGGLSLHSTIVATIAAGAGNSAQKGKGVAPEATVCFLGEAYPTPDADERIAASNATVQNHSYGHDMDYSYGIYANTYDSSCLNHPTLVHVFSSGNSGEKESANGVYSGMLKFGTITGQYKMAKNVISVGEINAHDSVKRTSSCGPAYDGRIMPSLVAYGEMGSSESAPLVSGVCLLVQDVYRKVYGQLPTSDMVRAILFNSATDVGRSNVDFESGYGSVNANGAISTVVEKRIIAGEVSKGECFKQTINVPSGSNLLKVTLAWLDPPAQLKAKVALTNDLDLSIKQLGNGKVWLPWVLNADANSLLLPASRGIDSLNNAEQITISLPESGAYEVCISGTKLSTGKQVFSVAYEFGSSFSWVFPLRDSKVESGSAMHIRWTGYSGSDVAMLQYRNFGNNTWTTISNAVNLSNSYFDWTVPSEVLCTQLRLVADNFEQLSDTFVVSKPMKMSTLLNCGSEVLLSWNRVDGFDCYHVYSVSNGSLGRISTTRDTSILLKGSDLANHFYAVCPVYGGLEGVKSHSINYTNGGPLCYIKSFYPEYAVTDTVLLRVEFSTTFQLLSATLERWNGNQPVEVKKLDLSSNGQMLLLDDLPVRGVNRYRIRLNLTDSREIYSDEVAVTYIQVGNLMVYPNPVSIGQELKIVDGQDGCVEVVVYDISGRLLCFYQTDMGMEKTISIDNLPRGNYVIEVKSANGYKKAARIAVF